MNVLADIILVFFSLNLLKDVSARTRERLCLKMIASTPFLTAVLSVIHGVSFVVKGGRYERILDQLLVCFFWPYCVRFNVYLTLC